LLLLEEMVGEHRETPRGTGCVLYAETMIAGYERKEAAAGDAEDAALLLLGEHPSEKAVSLGCGHPRRSWKREYGPAGRLAEEVEASRFATGEMLAQARLIHAEAALFEENSRRPRARRI